MKRKGISLIVLVITIVVIIILAAAVILSLGKNNPINSAKEAKVRQSMDTFNSDLGIQVANKLLNDTTITVEDIDSKDEDSWRITDLIPSIKGTEYESQLIVKNGKIKLKDGSTLPQETKKIIKEFLGEAITPEMITSNPRAYIGKSVSYTGYSENTNNINWELFGLDENSNIMLVSRNSINLDYKTSSYPTGIIQGNDKYGIKATTNRSDLMNYLSTPNNWSEFAVSGKTTARGAMTLKEIVNAYNLVEKTKIEMYYLTANQVYPDDSSKTAQSNGYVIKDETKSYSDMVIIPGYYTKIRSS